MNKILLLIALMSFNAFAYDRSYSVSGEDENGNSVEGTIYSSNGVRDVEGEVTDENELTQDFHGQWDGSSRITGETDEGTSVELNTD